MRDLMLRGMCDEIRGMGYGIAKEGLVWKTGWIWLWLWS